MSTTIVAIVYQQLNIFGEFLNYSPTTCTASNYKFTFIFDNFAKRFKVHGLWIDGCYECDSCGYPTCCNPDKIVYTEPNDPSNFIETNWYDSSSNEECILHEKVSLFKHEYYKHISCSNITNTTDFLNVVIDLYDKYYDEYVLNKCNGSNELWLDLDENMEYVKTECIEY